MQNSFFFFFIFLLLLILFVLPISSPLQPYKSWIYCLFLVFFLTFLIERTRWCRQIFRAIPQNLLCHWGKVTWGSNSKATSSAMTCWTVISWTFTHLPFYQWMCNCQRLKREEALSCVFWECWQCRWALHQHWLHCHCWQTHNGTDTLVICQQLAKDCRLQVETLGIFFGFFLVFLTGQYRKK